MVQAIVAIIALLFLCAIAGMIGYAVGVNKGKKSAAAGADYGSADSSGGW